MGAIHQPHDVGLLIAALQVHACAVLGAGGFGQVLLVRYKDGNHYALKCVAKSFVQDQGLVAHIKREKVGQVVVGLGRDVACR